MICQPILTLSCYTVLNDLHYVQIGQNRSKSCKLFQIGPTFNAELIETCMVKNLIVFQGNFGDSLKFMRHASSWYCNIQKFNGNALLRHYGNNPNGSVVTEGCILDFLGALTVSYESDQTACVYNPFNNNPHKLCDCGLKNIVIPDSYDSRKFLYDLLIDNKYCLWNGNLLSDKCSKCIHRSCL